MFAKQENFLSFLKASEKLRIPIYQRKYSWNIKQCEELLNDILDVSKSNNEATHFIGSVVYIKEKHTFAGELNTFLVIDGQQRITTISLLISALCNYIKENGSEIDYTKLFDYYLINSKEKGNDQYKLLLTKDDELSYIKIMDSFILNSELSFDESDSVRIKKNYGFFKNEINDDNYLKIYEGLHKLMFVQIDLERGKDNPQLIFESLNSTGLELNSADLIRNYILMGLEKEEQDYLYENYWHKMENRFNHEANSQFDTFIRHFLTIKLNRLPVDKYLYEEFKKYSAGKEINELVADVEKHSKFYANIVFAKDEDKEINTHFKDLENLNYTLHRPFIMSAYIDYTNGIIDKKEFIEILELVESYLFRRYVCDIPTPSLNKTFSSLHFEVDKKNYIESLKTIFVLKVQDRDYKRFPEDEEFKEKFLVRDVYNLRNRNYILSKFENYLHKEPLNVEDYTIEHIMPQKLDDDWINSLGENYEEIHEKFLHTIGNLTLTCYNSELSNKPFIEKRDMKGGFKDSHFRLNSCLRGLDSWNREKIIDRAEKLINLGLKIWKYPKVSSVPTLDDFTQYTLEDFENLKQEPTKSLFEKLRTKILNIDSIVTEEPKKTYIAYKSSSNFVDIIPYQSFITLSLSIPFDEINDEKGMCRDVEGVGHWGSGNTEFKLSSLDDIDYAFDLITQAFDYNYPWEL